MGNFADKRRSVLTGALEPSRHMRICDVGASPLSVPPYQGLLDDGVAHVYGFEPNPEQYEKLVAEGRPNETYFCKAVGLPGQRTLYVHPAAGFTSLYPMDAAALRSIGKEGWLNPKIEAMPLTTVTLDTLADLPDLDLLKMDLQGGELEVLRGGLSKLSRAVAIVAEVRFHRIYEGEPMFGDLDQELRAQGFKLHKFLFTKSVMMPHEHEEQVVRARLTSQLLDGDAVYIRDADVGAEFSDDQLMHLAFAADSVFNSPDLALHCMDHLIGRGAAPADLPDEYIARFRHHQRRDTAAEEG
ncbi:FkbM family methyltransferase [Nioella nitratireducens]|uniref:FkbM family methyltransferase n=1 Tax=Nioella nitratireducens TaxID=1287720 RepID=UPI0008FD7AEB|nr:FkbM family methyltransferase [Nioella nitratireducens]